MAQYTICIELHEAGWGDFLEMYKHLAVQGIKDIISSGEGIKYKPPPAECNCEGGAAREVVLEMAKDSTRKGVRSCFVLVTKTNGYAWHDFIGA